MSRGWEWPGPDQPTCGAVAIHRSTERQILCLLRKGHESTEHYWQHINGDTLLSATWIGDTTAATYIGGGDDL